MTETAPSSDPVQDILDFLTSRVGQFEDSTEVEALLEGTALEGVPLRIVRESSRVMVMAWVKDNLLVKEPLAPGLLIGAARKVFTPDAIDSVNPEDYPSTNWDGRPAPQTSTAVEVALMPQGTPIPPLEAS